VEEAHVESRRAGYLDPDHLLGPPLLPDLLHDLPRDAGAAHLGPRLDPHRGVPQPPEIGSGQRQLGHPRRRPRSPGGGMGRSQGNRASPPRRRRTRRARWAAHRRRRGTRPPRSPAAGEAARRRARAPRGRIPRAGGGGG
jgi:hypothetical protein